MPSNSEMYERGALDAEHDDLNPFYYQHYYYYRKGYDEGRRRLRRADTPGQPRRSRAPLLLGLIAVIASSLVSIYLLRNPLVSDTAASPAAPTALAEPTARPTMQPTAPPTAAPTASPPPALAVGRRARVVTPDNAPLRMRAEPGTGGRLLARVPSGTEVELLEGPVEGENFVWWRVRASESEGWCAAAALDGSVIFLEPLP